MSRYILLFITLILSSSLYASGPFTLTNLKCVKISVKSKTNLFDKTDIKNIEKILYAAAHETKLKTDERDCASLRVTLEAIDANSDYYLYTKLWIGEDIVTNRPDKNEAYALTYYSSDFTKSQDIHDDIVESVQNLVDDFVNHYNSDNEK